MRERTSHMGLHIHVSGQRAKISDDFGIIIDQADNRMECKRNSTSDVLFLIEFQSPYI